MSLTYNASDPKPGTIPPQPPQSIKELFLNRAFVQNSRNYNNALAMASIGMTEIAQRAGGWNPGFRIQGKAYHLIGPLLPELPQSGQPQPQPAFAQIYFYDPEHELQNRRAHHTHSRLNEGLLLKAQQVLHTCNPLIKEFKSVVEYVSNLEAPEEVKIYLTARGRPQGIHQGTMNLPSGSDIAVILPGGN